MKLALSYLPYLFFAFVLFSCNTEESRVEKPIIKMEQVDLVAPEIESYVSLTCEKGDITLVLDDDSTFYLDIKYWDDKLKKHTGSDNLKGSWKITGRYLDLTTEDNNKLKYELTDTPMEIKGDKINCKSYAFRSGDKKFFGTGYDLLDQKQADSFLKAAMK